MKTLNKHGLVEGFGVWPESAESVPGRGPSYAWESALGVEREHMTAGGIDRWTHPDVGSLGLL